MKEKTLLASRLTLDKKMLFVHTEYMATKKKAAKKVTRKTTSVMESEAMTSELTTDTKTIVVVLLLIFVYPIGVIFMWVWMKWWPKWVKILVTIPFVMAILGIIFTFMIAGTIMHNAMREQDQMNNMPYQRHMQRPMQQQNQYYISPTPPSNY